MYEKYNNYTLFSGVIPHLTYRSLLVFCHFYTLCINKTFTHVELYLQNQMNK